MNYRVSACGTHVLANFSQRVAIRSGCKAERVAKEETMMIRARESKSAPVGVVGKVLRVLEALDASPNGLQLREISQQTRVNKSTAYRFVAHLEKEGYLFRDAVGAYIVGPKLARLGAGVAFHATL